MRQQFIADHGVDTDGNPAGGYSIARGINIEWQNGPLGTKRYENGAFVETLIAIAMDRIEFYQQSQFACEENKEALSALKAALHALENRTANRQLRGVEGTHQV